MNSEATHFEEILKIFSSGRVTDKVDHPLVHTLKHPLFRRITTLSDQVVFLMNHSNMTYEYVSENVVHIFGATADRFLDEGLQLTLTTLHPEDLVTLKDVVFVEFDRCLSSLNLEDKKRIRLDYTLRIIWPDNSERRLLQQSIPVLVEDGKVLLGLMVITDISAIKKDPEMAYRVSLVHDTRPTEVLAEGNCESTGVFSKRERDVLELTADGLSEKEIADKLYISTHTVKSHRKSMLRKAGVKNTPELVRFGLANFIL